MTTQAKLAGFDLLVIGTGAAGMAAAIRGAELGRRVAIVEAGTVGGTCVNIGCIPSKNLIAAAAHYHAARQGFPGIAAVDPTVDWRRVQSQKRALVHALREAKYMDVLAAYQQIKLLRGRATLRGNGAVEVEGQLHQAQKIVVATGTSPWLPPLDGIDDVDVLNSTTAMELDAVPSSMIVLGGSAVGLELGQVFARFGSRITVLELMPRIVPTEAESAADELRSRLEQEGVTIRTATRATRIERRDGGVTVFATTAGANARYEADLLLVAAGRRSNIGALALEDAGVEVDEQGFIMVDEHMRTSNPDIFAAGDVTGGPGFVYVAAVGGRIAADNALGEASRALDLSAVPRVTFTSPQLAAVGLTPKEAGQRGLQVDVRRLELEHVPRALVEHQAAGWIEIVAEQGTGRILGVHAVAPNAGELLGEATLAVRLGLTISDLADTLHPYLTWVEGLKLAAQTFTTDVSKLSCCA